VSNTVSPTPNGWDVVDGALHRRLTFADFAAAFAFMTRVAEIAEEHDHHPDWSNSWNVVEISLQSHDAGGVITERDVRLARRINEVLS
jgi:4a-hydroxytetrahydrobiopterin dehydratase